MLSTNFFPKSFCISTLQIHHEFTAPVAMAAYYAHPIEHMVLNVLPVMVAAKLVCTHVLTFFVFLSVVLFTSCTGHSGYDFFGRMAQHHDKHHELRVKNFGTIMTLFDRLHSTYALDGGQVQAKDN